MHRTWSCDMMADLFVRHTQQQDKGPMAAHGAGVIFSLHCQWEIWRQHAAQSWDAADNGALNSCAHQPLTLFYIWGFLPWEIRVAFPRESQLWQSCATQPTMHGGCFSVSIIHQSLAWTTGSLTCAQMLMHAIAHKGVKTSWESLHWKLTLGEKIPCRTGKLKLCQWHASPMLYQLSYIPTPHGEHQHQKCLQQW